MGRDDEQSDGQVSEVQKMDGEDAGTPISDDQSVNAQPDGESGEVQEGPAGPNAWVPGDDGTEPAHGN
ncbi:hypothetical protein LG324_08485 [Phycicoccus jejuensis]|uniref:hypothetical protein n=1 Tax=Phycicoccus TaxID=367298 RepID=UPI0004C38B78|nr:MULTISPECIES: hypothetical protein [Phycicoccus]GIL35632.1 hypothetical protein PDTK01_17070 [Phycicoccus sp. DTK01]